MFDSTFVGMFDSTGLTLGNLLVSIGAALIIGLVIAAIYQFRTPCSKSFLVTLASLPAIVAVVIMMVGGNIGTGVAVAGTFSLVRFRSMPGTAKEICAVFLAMAVGLACGMGYPIVGVILALMVSLFNVVLSLVNFGAGGNSELRKNLRITLPEDLDYSTIFDDILARYTTSHKLVTVKTTNLGSLNKLTYEITLKKAGTEKDMIDELRCRNGNLEISISTMEMNLRDL